MSPLVAILVVAFAGLIIVLTSWGMMWPQRLAQLLRTLPDRYFMMSAVGSRVVLAVILWLAAPVARHPLVFKLLAIVALLAAGGLLLAGRERATPLIEWWAHLPVAIQRLWVSLGLLFGGYLLWAIWPALAVG